MYWTPNSYLTGLCLLAVLSLNSQGVSGLEKFKSCIGEPAVLSEYAAYLDDALKTAVLPHWQSVVDQERGGYNVEIGEKHIISQTRLVWTFSEAYLRFGETPGVDNLASAKKGVDFILAHFLDNENGGYFWSTDDDGKVVDDGKFMIAQLTALAALAKHYRASNEERSRDAAFSLLSTLTKKARDTMADKGGWLESFTRDWVPLTEGSGPVGENGRKTVNITIIFLDALIELLRATNCPEARSLLMEILETEVPRFITPNPKDAIASIGLNNTVIVEGADDVAHLIETVWLIIDAQGALGLPKDWNLFDAYMQYAIHNLDPVTGGITSLGGIPWWAQGEFLASFALSQDLRGEVKDTSALVKLLDLIVCKFTSLEDGLWVESVDSKGNILDERRQHRWKAGFHAVRGMTTFTSAFINT